MSRLFVLMCLVAAMGFSQAALATTVDFEGASLVHGRVVDTDFAAQGIASITASNVGGGPDLAVIFDSDFAGGTTDPDLLNPWSGGNLGGTSDSGNLLIIQENSTGCGDDICNDPDDEGSRPAGTLDIVFNTPVVTFGFDLFDVESTSLENGSITFFDGASSFTIDWSDFEAGSGSVFEVAGVVYADNFGNRIPEIAAASVGLTQFDRVLISMGGSGALDNFVFTPEPAVSWLLLGGFGAYLVGRRRR